MTPQQRIWFVLGGLFVVSMLLLGSITLPGSTTSSFLTVIVAISVGIAIYYDRQGRQHH